ncbi:BTB/POZ domain-containing protein 8-like [Ruditapes philippinarum]|uniref:BTB/POZ domain-containing protein 8-like n=1 Tax=Ruditapes philippinarum TaxID=129788 RepID=UPI00295AA0B9|nr:BTB/POZ domain-containing protein 8-like [Ruditapes philippinarum]
MARPKEKARTAFDQKCMAASDKLASFQATSLKDDIERLYTDEILTDLSIDLGSRKLALHRCIIKARNADLCNFLTSFERNDGNEALLIPNSRHSDIENCLRSLYTDDDVTASVEKLDTYFQQESNIELEQPNTDNTNDLENDMIDTDRDTLHVISENITNTSLDLVKSEVGCLKREICIGEGERSNGCTSICDNSDCDKYNDKMYGSVERGNEAGNKTSTCDNTTAVCGCEEENDEENIYKLAERIVKQVIEEAQSIVAKDKSDNPLDNIAKENESAKEVESLIYCNDSAEIEKKINSSEKDNNGQNSIKSNTSPGNQSNTSVENQAQQTKCCRFNTRTNIDSIQGLQERVFGVKTLLRPCSKLGEDLLRMLLEQESTDCSIEVQGETFRAHRCILAARSSYFAAMLCGSWRESEEETIVLEGILPAVLKQTLLYLYGGVTQVDPQCPLGGLIMMADMYGMEGLKEVVAFNLNIGYCHFFHRPCAECIAGVPEALALTMMYNMDAMKEKCVRWINKNFGKVWPGKSLATLPQEVLEFTVSSAVKDLALNNVLDVLVDCQRLNEKTPHLKWTEPVFDMITQLMDAAIEFASKNFISLISGNTFRKIDKEGISFNQQPLEDIFGMIIQALSPENSCLAYLSLHKWVKSVEVTADDKVPLFSEEFAEFVNTLFKKCKDHLCLYVHQAANTVEWELLSKEMQQTIMQDANYVCIDTNRGRMARPKLTSMQKKISATSPLSLKEYFECHFGQVKPPVKIPKSKKENIPAAKQKEVTKGTRGKVKQASADTRKMDKSSVKTVKQTPKLIGKDTSVYSSGKKGAKGKSLTDQSQSKNDMTEGCSNSALFEEDITYTEEEYIV